MRPSILLPLAGTVIVLAAAGCGGGSGRGGAGASGGSGGAGGGSGGGGQPVKTIRIVEKEFSLTPAAVSISKPGLYVFQGVNQGTVSHGLAIEGNGLDMDGPIVSPGKTSTLRVTIAKQGSYELYCPVGNHRQMGMEAKLTLGAAGSSGTSTGTSTGSDGYGYG